MYLEYYYRDKGSNYLRDKSIPSLKKVKINTLINLKIDISSKHELQVINPLCFLFSNMWDSKIIFKNRIYSSLIYKKFKIFDFIENFILTWLPLMNEVKINLSANSVPYMKFNVDSIPPIEELEYLFELNSNLLNLLNYFRINVSLFLFSLNHFDKENIFRFFKFPIQSL